MSPISFASLYRRRLQRRSLHSAPLALLALALSCCVGSIDGRGGTDGEGGQSPPTGGGASGGGGDVEAAVTCDPRAVPAVQAWRRLSSIQYRNTLRDLLTFALKSPDLASAVSNELPSLAGLPADQRKNVPLDPHGSYRRLDQDVEQSLVDQTYEIATAVGDALTTTKRLGTVVGACATDADTANDKACVGSFVQSFGERVLRRPLAPAETEAYRTFAGAGPITARGMSDVIAGLLTAPQFLYHIEHGDKQVAGRDGVFALTPFELASRLSYQFWETMPDSELMEAAKNGELSSADGYTKQVDRVFADARTRAPLDEFYREWLKLEDLKPLDTRAADPTFRTFAGGDLPKSDVHRNMVEDVMSLVRYYTWEKQGTLNDLFSTNLSFAKTPDLAKIYGVPVWTGGSPPAFPEGLRPGLLTRALFLSTGSATTRPVMKGVFTRTTILCDEIPPPPDNAANANMTESSAKLSTRQMIEGLTESPGTPCAGCHQTLINPIGFATENFDALGRVRTEQRLFSSQGVEVARAPVNTHTVPQIVAGDETVSEGAADLMRLIADSGKAHTCFSRQYFRYTFARWDDLSTDGCVVNRVNKMLNGEGSLQSALKVIAMVPEFQQRTIK